MSTCRPPQTCPYSEPLICVSITPNIGRPPPLHSFRCRRVAGPGGGRLRPARLGGLGAGGLGLGGLGLGGWGLGGLGLGGRGLGGRGLGVGVSFVAGLGVLPEGEGVGLETASGYSGAQGGMFGRGTSTMPTGQHLQPPATGLESGPYSGGGEQG